MIHRHPHFYGMFNLFASDRTGPRADLKVNLDPMVQRQQRKEDLRRHCT